MSMEHEFWIFREEEYKYLDYTNLSSLYAAPVKFNDDVIRYFWDTIIWIPTFNPAKNKWGNGLNMWGPTIIEKTGGRLFSQVFTSWAQLFAAGPKRLQLRGSFSWQWPYDDVSKHLINEDDLYKIGNYEQLEVDRDGLIQQLMILASFGEKASTGNFFIFHLGI